MTDKSPNELQSLIQRFDAFVEQYELDMRGDMKIEHGNLGLVNALRQLAERVEKYPSLTWLFAHRPAKTISTTLAVWLLIWGLTVLGIVKFAGVLFGIDLPDGCP